MLKNVFLFYGENDYLLRQELLRWKKSFLEKYGPDALFHFNSQNWDLGMVKQALYAGGLFVSKKMVILEGVPKDGVDSGGISADKIDTFFTFFQENLHLLPEDTLAVFVSSKPDKRTKAFKRLNENVQLKVFNLYKEAQLRVFIAESFPHLHFSVDGLEYFFLKVGMDMYRVAHELEKLGFAVQNHQEITPEVVDQFCFGDVEGDAFVILDQLFASPLDAVASLEKMEQDGKSWNEVQGLLLWGVRIYLTLIDYARQGIVDSKQIISATKLHPFVVNKNLKHLPLLLKHQDFIVYFFRMLLDLEYAIKNGTYPDSYYWLAVKREILHLA